MIEGLLRRELLERQVTIDSRPWSIHSLIFFAVVTKVPTTIPQPTALVWIATLLRHEEGIQASSKQRALIWRQWLWWGFWWHWIWCIVVAAVMDW